MCLNHRLPPGVEYTLKLEKIFLVVSNVGNNNYHCIIKPLPYVRFS
jgi:hypothetical protein